MSSNILESMSTIEWWLSVAFVGIALNLISRYLGKAMDRIVGSVSRRLTDASSAARELRARAILEVRQDQKHRQRMVEAEMRSRLRAITFLFMSVFFLLVTLGDEATALPKWLALTAYALSLLLWSAGLLCIKNAGDCSSILAAADDLSSES